MSSENSNKPRVGIPWRTSEEERQQTREKLDYYFAAVRRAGGHPVEVSLSQPGDKLSSELRGLDAFLLPGSPADVEPDRYGAARHEKTKMLDPDRDKTDSAILDHAIREHKPVLAICYGCQILNVHRRGTLVQDIRDEKPGSAVHGNTDLAAGAKQGDAEHEAVLAPGSRLAQLAGGERVHVNSSHHQSIGEAGRGLRVTARAADGIIEGVELASERDWVVGVQWHPERMAGSAFAENLFRDFVAAAERSRTAAVQK